jgi:hypothetical protein
MRGELALGKLRRRSLRMAPSYEWAGKFSPCRSPFGLRLRSTPPV